MRTNVFCDLEGYQAFGSYLQVAPCVDVAFDMSNCILQWFRTSSDRGKREPKLGATKPVYAPEPFDVGRFLQAEIIFDSQTYIVTTTSLIDPAAGLGSYVETLVRKPDNLFNFSFK